ncbi:hypothetical protein V3C99_007215, partial [Haemonchus contortus]
TDKNRMFSHSTLEQSVRSPRLCRVSALLGP